MQGLSILSVDTFTITDPTKAAPPATPEEVERAERETKALLTENSLALEAQLEERPLAKRQGELDEASEDVDPASVSSAVGPEHSPAEETDVADHDDNHSTSSKSEKHHKKALLKNDDVELERISKVRAEPSVLGGSRVTNFPSYWMKFIVDFSRLTMLLHPTLKNLILSADTAFPQNAILHLNRRTT